jgi:hypothetical protein
MRLWYLFSDGVPGFYNGGEKGIGSVASPTGVRTKIGKTDSTSPQSVRDRQKRQPLELSDAVDEADCVEGARAAIIMACAAIGVPVFLRATRIDAETRSTSDSNGLTVNAPITASA